MLVRLALLCLLLPALPLHAGEERPLLRIEWTAPDDALAGPLANVAAGFRLQPGDDSEDEERQLRAAERAVRERLAVAGRFSPKLEWIAPEQAAEPYVLKLDPGPPAQVASLDIRFSGAIEAPAWAERRDALRQDWKLAVGSAFTVERWEAAKTALLAQLQARDFPQARLAQSNADIDAGAAAAHLTLDFDSGPAVRIGALEIVGLARHEPRLIEGYNPFTPGEPYDRGKLAAFQQALQDTPYFASVSVTVPPDPPDPQRAPIRVEVTEAKTRRVAVAIGFATNTGAQAEIAYRQSVLFGQPYALNTGARVDQTGTYGFADVALPPKPGGARDSVGVLGEASEIENLRVRRWAVGAVRSFAEAEPGGHDRERTYGLFYNDERRTTPLGQPVDTRSVYGSAGWTWRNVNSLTNPRSGHVLSLGADLGYGRADTSGPFGRATARGQQYFSLTDDDVLNLRAELGGVATRSNNLVPESLLFRTGGATSVRGYSFESLGVESNGAIVGGRVLAVGSIELTHWFGQYGLAAFVDAGDAQQSLRNLDIALGYGVGARWQTLAGPLAIDVAYGEKFSQWRVHFSVALAF